jgi:hypothetical protein
MGVEVVLIKPSALFGNFNQSTQKPCGRFPHQNDAIPFLYYVPFKTDGVSRQDIKRDAIET